MSNVHILDDEHQQVQQRVDELMSNVHILDVVTTLPIPHERVLDGAAEDLDPESPMGVLGCDKEDEAKIERMRAYAVQAPWGETTDSELLAQRQSDYADALAGGMSLKIERDKERGVEMPIQYYLYDLVRRVLADAQAPRGQDPRPSAPHTSKAC